MECCKSCIHRFDNWGVCPDAYIIIPGDCIKPKTSNICKRYEKDGTEIENQLCNRS